MPAPDTLTQRFAAWSARSEAVPDGIRRVARWLLPDGLDTDRASQGIAKPVIEDGALPVRELMSVTSRR